MNIQDILNRIVAILETDDWSNTELDMLLDLRRDILLDSLFGDIPE